ncbi:MAG: hypothetical protein ACOY3K_01105 [Candidatus Omnitrophota bacterium]
MKNKIVAALILGGIGILVLIMLFSLKPKASRSKTAETSKTVETSASSAVGDLNTGAGTAVPRAMKAGAVPTVYRIPKVPKIYTATKTPAVAGPAGGVDTNITRLLRQVSAIQTSGAGAAGNAALSQMMRQANVHERILEEIRKEEADAGSPAEAGKKDAQAAAPDLKQPGSSPLAKATSTLTAGAEKTAAAVKTETQTAVSKTGSPKQTVSTTASPAVKDDAGTAAGTVAVKPPPENEEF